MIRHSMFFLRAPEGDILNPSPTPTPSERPGKITCEFCECELGRSGEYKQLSETAKKYRKLKDENEKLEGTLATVRQEVEDLKRKLEEARPKEKERKVSGLMF